METFGRNMKLNLTKIDASKKFLDKLKGVSDPEQKRKIIGNEFVYTFDEEVKKLAAVSYTHLAADLLLRPGLCRSVPGFRPVHGRSAELAAEEKELAAESDEAGRYFIDCHGIVDEYSGGGVHF